jgi:hypothetical protein
MHLTISPTVGLPGQPETTLNVAGDVLTIDGTAYDLSPVPEGGEGWPDGETSFVGPIRRIGGVIHATVIARLGDDAASFQPTDPAHWIIPDAQGDVTIPAIRKPVEVTP